MTWTGVRRLWFQVHKWIGIALFILIIPISLSGSVLLAHDWMEQVEGAEAPPPPLPMSRYIAAATPHMPLGARVAAISYPTEDAPAVIVAAVAAGEAEPVRVALDPATAMPMTLDEGEDAFFEGTLHRFHGNLLLPVAGRPIVGWLGVALLISSLTGLWLWWPMVGRWSRGLRWRRGPEFDFNLHHLVGFWIALPLALLSLSGAWISFPGFFSSLTGEETPRRLAPREGEGEGRDQPLEAPRLSPDAVATQFGRQGPVRRIVFPTEARAGWIAQAPGEGEGGVTIDDRTGALAPLEVRRQGPVMGWMRDVHEGDRETGPVWRAIAVLGGVAPAALGVTGITMWLRSRRWRAAVADRMTRDGR